MFRVIKYIKKETGEIVDIVAEVESGEETLTFQIPQARIDLIAQYGKTQEQALEREISDLLTIYEARKALEGVILIEEVL